MSNNVYLQSLFVTMCLQRIKQTKKEEEDTVNTISNTDSSKLV